LVDLSPGVEFAVLVHEIAHELLHRGQAPRRDVEERARNGGRGGRVRRVARHRTQDHQGASDYILRYVDGKETLFASLEAIRRTSAQIREALQGERRVSSELALRSA
jgi:hypothetical protein